MQGRDSESKAQANEKTETIMVYYFSGLNLKRFGIGHVAIWDGQYYYSHPANPAYTRKKATDEANLDHNIYGNYTPFEINVTHKEKKNIQEAGEVWRSKVISPDSYHLYGENCADMVQDLLCKAGLLQGSFDHRLFPTLPGDIAAVAKDLANGKQSVSAKDYGWRSNRLLRVVLGVFTLLGLAIGSILWPKGSYGSDAPSLSTKALYFLAGLILVGVACTGVGLIAELAVAGTVSLAAFVIFMTVGSVTTLTGASAIACGAAICAVIGGWLGVAFCKMKTLFADNPAKHASASSLSLDESGSACPKGSCHVDGSQASMLRLFHDNPSACSFWEADPHDSRSVTPDSACNSEDSRPVTPTDIDSVGLLYSTRRSRYSFDEQGDELPLAHRLGAGGDL